MANRVTIDQLAAWLKERDDFILIGHISPDGDAVGSCIATMLALRALGKRVCVCLPEAVPAIYGTYPCAEEVLVRGDALPFTPQAAFALDVSEPDRMGEAKALFEACESRAVLDHHETNTGFGQLYCLDGDAAAAGELVLTLIEALGVKLSKEMAQWLYIAISTDCGNFNYSNTRAETMEAAAKLLRVGVDVAKLTRELYHTRSRARTQLLGLVLSTLAVSENGKVAWSRLTDEMLARAGALREDNEGVVNYLLEICGVEIAVLAEERDGGTKFSLRSKEKADVAQIAKAFGGGGHVRAAGCMLALPMEEALKSVLAYAEKALENT